MTAAETRLAIAALLRRSPRWVSDTAILRWGVYFDLGLGHDWREQKKRLPACAAPCRSRKGAACWRERDCRAQKRKSYKAKRKGKQ